MSNKDDNFCIPDLIVVKRSGQRVEFNGTKIALAIKKSFDQVYFTDSGKQINKVYEDVLDYIEKNYRYRKTINVEDIQDIIEERLKANKYMDVYDAFNEYRTRRADSRKAFSIKQQHKFVKAIERIINQNSKNINSSPNELLLNFGKTISAEYTKAYVLENKLVRAHEEGNIYIHNLDYFHLGKISSTHLRLDNNVKDEFSRNLLFSITEAKQEIDGEICIDAIDELLVSMVVKKFKSEFNKNLSDYLMVTDYLDYINIKKIEEIVEKELSVDIELNKYSQFILNDKVKKIFEFAKERALMRTKQALQDFFKDILYNLNDNHQENQEYSISLGANLSKEGFLISDCYLDCLADIAPTPHVTTIFKIRPTSDTSLLNKVSNLILMGKNIAFSFIDTTYNRKANTCVEYFSNGKRVFENEIYEEYGSLGRMIVSSVSINMGRLGIKHENGSQKNFFEEFDEMLELAKNGLISIFENIGNKNKENYRLIFNGNILDDDKLEYGQKIRKILKKGVLNLELAGLYECVVNLAPDTESQKKLLIKILKYAKERCQKYSKDYKLNFIVSETSKKRPLRKLMELDKSIYGMKKNVTDQEQYRRIDSLFKFKKDIKKDLHEIGLYQEILSGGNLVKILLPQSTNVREILNIIKIAEQENVGFLKLEVRK